MSEKCPGCGAEVIREPVVGELGIIVFECQARMVGETFLESEGCLRRQLSRLESEKQAAKTDCTAWAKAALCVADALWAMAEGKERHDLKQLNQQLYAVFNTKHPGSVILEEVQRLREIASRSLNLLRVCRSDIFQTARVNQGNINGIELNSPRGIDESLSLIKDIDTLLTHAANIIG